MLRINVRFTAYWNQKTNNIDSNNLLETFRKHGRPESISTRQMSHLPTFSKSNWEDSNITALYAPSTFLPFFSGCNDISCLNRRYITSYRTIFNYTIARNIHEAKQSLSIPARYVLKIHRPLYILADKKYCWNSIFTAHWKNILGIGTLASDIFSSFRCVIVQMSEVRAICVQDILDYLDSLLQKPTENRTQKIGSKRTGTQRDAIFSFSY